jgi:hypothetical protein
MLTSFTLAVISARHGSAGGSVLDNSKSVPVKTNTPSSK